MRLCLLTQAPQAEDAEASRVTFKVRLPERTINVTMFRNQSFQVCSWSSSGCTRSA